MAACGVGREGNDVAVEFWDEEFAEIEGAGLVLGIGEAVLEDAGGDGVAGVGEEDGGREGEEGGAD